MEQPVREYRGQRIWFAEPGWIRASTNVRIAVNPPEERQTVLQADRPWENQFIAFYVSVLEDEGRYRMWYTCRDKAGRGNLAYAESADGANWVKPELGLVEYEGNRANNLVGIADLEGTVFIDPKAPPERRYNYLTTVFKQGIYLYTSADGYRWRKEKQPFLRFMADSQIISFFDERLGRYRIYLRGWEGIDKPFAERKRTVVGMTAGDLTKGCGIEPDEDAAYLWKESEVPALSRELPVVYRCDGTDDEACDVYTMAAMAYPPDPSYFVAFPAHYWHAPERPDRKLPNDGRTEVRLIGGTDGSTWHRYDRAPYWKPGREGSETSEMVFAGYGMVLRGDQLWHYGTGYRTTHGDIRARMIRADGVIMLLKHRLDGFVSADTSHEGGELVTAPVVCGGNRLVVNVDTGADGYARFEIRNAEGEVCESRTVQDCDAIRANSVHRTVTWNGSADLSAWAGKPITVRVVSKSCKLYSLRFVDAAGDSGH